MTLELLAILLAGGIAQTALLALLLWWRDKRTPHAELEVISADVKRLGGWITRVERERRERDDQLEEQVSALSESVDARFAELRRELPAEVGAVVVREVMEAIGRQRERKGTSEIEQALGEAKAARKAVEEEP